MNLIKNKLSCKGFTLVELLIVIAVLGVIAGIGISSMTGITDTFKIKADSETARMLARNVEINILAGEIVSGSATSVKDMAQAIVAKDRPSPQSGGVFAVKSLDLTTGKIIITFGTGDPLDEVEIDISIDSID